jgi:hypothetical protein
MAIQPIFNRFATRPTTATLKNTLGGDNVRDVYTHQYQNKQAKKLILQLIRDQLPVSTWLVIGALIQGLAHLLLPYRNIVLILPVLLFLSYKLITTLLILMNILPNTYMRDVIPGRTTIVYPDSRGQQENSGTSPICAILLSVVSHHPLGMLAPGYSAVGERFQAMTRELSADASLHGFLGATNWLNASERATNNEFASIMYFENDEYLHAYAHGKMHTDTMLWWREEEKAGRVKHLGIMHEVFACPEKGWEGIYVNYHPTGK